MFKLNYFILWFRLQVCGLYALWIHELDAWKICCRFCRECGEVAQVGIEAKIGGDPIMLWKCCDHAEEWLQCFNTQPVGTKARVHLLIHGLVVLERRKNS